VCTSAGGWKQGRGEVVGEKRKEDPYLSLTLRSKCLEEEEDEEDEEKGVCISVVKRYTALGSRISNICCQEN
jgi:hypothetical protein